MIKEKAAGLNKKMSNEERKYQTHQEELGITIDYDEDIILKSTSTNEYVLVRSIMKIRTYRVNLS